MFLYLGINKDGCVWFRHPGNLWAYHMNMILLLIGFMISTVSIISGILWGIQHKIINNWKASTGSNLRTCVSLLKGGAGW